jgi:uncharacterized membrane protein
MKKLLKNYAIFLLSMIVALILSSEAIYAQDSSGSASTTTHTTTQTTFVIQPWMWIVGVIVILVIIIAIASGKKKPTVHTDEVTYTKTTRSKDDV